MTLTLPQILKKIQDLRAQKHYGSLTLKFEEGRVTHADIHSSIKIVDKNPRKM